MTPMESGVRARLWKALISAFIVFHLSAVAVWVLPPKKVKEWLRPVVQPYIWGMGLWQEWGMFAPNPFTLNFYIDAEISFTDGTRTIWTCPRMAHLGILAKYQKERYRKYAERVRPDDMSFLWPDLARHLARAHADGGKVPERVALRRHWEEIVPPLPQDAQPPRMKNRPVYPYSSTFFTYEVKLEDLA